MTRETKGNIAAGIALSTLVAADLGIPAFTSFIEYRAAKNNFGADMDGFFDRVRHGEIDLADWNEAGVAALMIATFAFGVWAVFKPSWRFSNDIYNQLR